MAQRAGSAGADRITPQDRVRREVLTRLLHGHPVDLASLSTSTRLTQAAVEEAMAALHAGGAIHRADGVVVAAYPLSGVPTRHWLRFGGTTAYANCAIDALAVPFMVDEAVSLTSDCAQCGAAITVQMHGEHVLAAIPDSPVVFAVARDCRETGPAVVTRCPRINFFCDADHASRWRAARPARVGRLLRLAEAIAEARKHFDRTIRLVRDTRREGPQRTRP